MGKYTSLAIYKETRTWVGDVIKLITHFKRSYKYSLGEDIRKHCIDFMAQIHRANINQDKRLEELINMVFIFERVHIELELAYDLGLIPKNYYYKIFMPMKEIQSQMHKWKKYVEDRKVKFLLSKNNENNNDEKEIDRILDEA